MKGEVELGLRRFKAAVVVTALWAFLWWLGMTVFASVVWLLFEKNAIPPFPPMPLLTFLKTYSLLALAVGVVAGALFTSLLIFTSPGKRREGSDRAVVRTGAAAGAMAGLVVGFVGMSFGALGSLVLFGFGACMGWLSATMSVDKPHRRLDAVQQKTFPQQSDYLLADQDQRSKLGGDR